ncbi:hypothetical protein XCR1_70030 [Xenorhabdus cabanillasii JM26]|uniref:Uncharacterized protein n=1 Tax=Xenorhabdus cabanillasii JM26 TaxID=1427517 RepID=W1J9Z1_9GAMM|nr:hypothetical protein XCR1_70030 [Xenorhabdus cabanillasii JM26]
MSYLCNQKINLNQAKIKFLSSQRKSYGFQDTAKRIQQNCILKDAGYRWLKIKK